MESPAPYYRAWPPGAAVRQAVIGRMPSGVVARTAEARAVTALLELADNSVWAVRLPFDVVGMGEGLFSVAEYLSDMEDSPFTRSWLSEGGSLALDFWLEVMNPTLDPDAEGFWKVREHAITEALKDHANTGMSDIGTLVARKVALNRSAIVEALAQFTDHLNRDAIDLATQPGCFSFVRYNFLVRGAGQEQLRYRSQFARTFPLFFSWVAGETEEPGKEVRAFREAIDNGEPLIPLLAAQFQVPQNVIRYLVNKDSASVGAQWRARIPVLLRVLASIAPEKRPANHADWGAFTPACDMLSQLLGRPITTPLSLSWLGTAFKRGFGGLADVLDGVEPRAVIAMIDELTDAMGIALSWELRRRAPGTGTGKIHEQCRFAIAGFVLAHHPLELYRRALRWRAEYNKARAAQAPVISPAGSWSTVLSGPVRIGDLSIVELDSFAALEEEGVRLNHCVAVYERRCRSGETHIFSVRDAEDKSLSTAEIKLVQRRAGAMACAVIQHQGMNDSKPEWQCSEAVGELLLILEGEPYSSRMVALHLTREGNGIGTGRLPREIDHLLATVDSVRKVLERHGAYEALIKDAATHGGGARTANAIGIAAGTKWLAAAL